MLILWVRIPPFGMYFITRECRMLSGTDLCFGLITRPVESSGCGVSECDCEASIKRRFWRTEGCGAIIKN
jgi:hypothetical protein